MLYDPHLDIFLKVAEAGSFSKAAAELFITPSAVIKKINLFEKKLGVVLFERSPRGLQLTAAGKSLQRDAVGVISICNEAVFHAREVMKERENAVRIGLSPMTPFEPISALWPYILEHEPELYYQMIPFHNNEMAAEKILPNLGRTIDLLVGIVDPHLMDKYGCCGNILRQDPICIGVPLTHPLAKHNLLAPEDLSGFRVMMPRRGAIEAFDQAREFLERNCPNVEIEEFEIFTVESFNQSQKNCSLIASLQSWGVVHPMIRMKSMKWDYKVPIGIMHSADPSPNVARFMDALHKCVKRLNP